MTIAWYGHLRFKEVPLAGVIVASWLIAFVEYCQLVARHGYRTPAQVRADQCRLDQNAMADLIWPPNRPSRVQNRAAVHKGRTYDCNRSQCCTPNMREEVEMKLPRQNFFRLAAGAAALPVIPGIAAALAYPARPVAHCRGISARRLERPLCAIDCAVAI